MVATCDGVGKMALLHTVIGRLQYLVPVGSKTEGGAPSFHHQMVLKRIERGYKGTQTQLTVVACYNYSVQTKSIVEVTSLGPVTFASRASYPTHCWHCCSCGGHEALTLTYL